MFTGIIKKLSQVENVYYKKDSFFVSIKTPTGWKIWMGESIAVNGVCSTVKEIKAKNFTVEYMPETTKKTTVGSFKKGSVVNLERSMKMSDLLDGHIVLGHVDTRGKIVDIKNAKGSKVMKIEVPQKFMKFIPDKGSIAVDGISLTVVEARKNWFTVSLVSFTLENTDLGRIRVGDSVNIETDVLAKYLNKLINKN